MSRVVADVGGQDEAGNVQDEALRGQGAVAEKQGKWRGNAETHCRRGYL